MNAPSKRLLNVGSLVLILFGAIVALVPIIGLIGSAKAVALFGGLEDIIMVLLILLFVVSMLELILGIVGLKRSGDPAKGRYFITAVIMLCALSLVSLVLSIAAGVFDVTILGIPAGILLIIGTVLPVLYIIGGSRNKKAVPPVA